MFHPVIFDYESETPTSPDTTQLPQATCTVIQNWVNSQGSGTTVTIYVKTSE